MQDIKPLLVFAAVLEHGSMNAAAAALGMTPSAVSQHINRLETLHGIKLLNRSTRSLAPTDAGRALGEYCRRLAATLSDTRTVIDNLKTEPVGELRISLTSSVIGSRAFQTAFSRLQTEFPKIRPVLNFSDTLDDLQHNQTDIAIRGGDRALDDPNLVARHLVTWPGRTSFAPRLIISTGIRPLPIPLNFMRTAGCIFYLSARPCKMVKKAISSTSPTALPARILPPSAA